MNIVMRTMFQQCNAPAHLMKHTREYLITDTIMYLLSPTRYLSTNRMWNTCEEIQHRFYYGGWQVNTLEDLLEAFYFE